MIRDQYSGHAICLDQLKASIQGHVISLNQSRASVTWSTVVTPRAAHIGLAVTLARLGAELLAGALVAHALVHRAVSLAVTQRADVRVSNLPLRILASYKSQMNVL